MMRDVPKADVVIVNPTHIAIAIKYDASIAPAPIVLAIGQRKVANASGDREGTGVPNGRRTNRSIVRCSVRQSRNLIPYELYMAVAENPRRSSAHRGTRGSLAGEHAP